VVGDYTVPHAWETEANRASVFQPPRRNDR
jgi:hypothetical protein